MGGPEATPPSVSASLLVCPYSHMLAPRFHGNIAGHFCKCSEVVGVAEKYAHLKEKTLQLRQKDTRRSIADGKLIQFPNVLQ